MSGQVFLGRASTKQGKKYLAQGHNTVTPPVASLELTSRGSLPTEPLCSAKNSIMPKIKFDDIIPGSREIIQHWR